MAWQRPVEVLLIEPNPRHAEIIKEALGDSGKRCALKIVDQPEQAKEFIESDSLKSEGGTVNPQLIIAELVDPRNPPAANLLQWLRGHRRTKHLPVVVLAVKDDPEAIQHAYDLGASSYLVKPEKESQLGQMVSSAVRYWIDLNHPPQ